MLSASLSSVFSHKVYNIRYEKEIRILSYLTLIELEPPVSESSTRISNFYDPTDSKYKFHKTRIENWLTIGFELGSPGWELTVITTTPCSTCTMMKSLKLLYIHLQSLVTNLETFHFPLTVQVFSKSTLSVHSSIKFQQNPTIVFLII